MGKARRKKVEEHITQNNIATWQEYQRMGFHLPQN
jgi:hypothetical protein